MNAGTLDYSNLERAVDSLSRAVDAYEEGQPALSAEGRELMRDGVIQRFEYTFELAWKTLRRYLEMYGLERVDALTNRDLFRVGFEGGLLRDPTAWFDYLTDRNRTSHIYNQDVAAEVYAAALRFLPDARFLIAQLRERVR